MATAGDLWLSQIRSGDTEAWREFIVRYEGRLVAFVNARLGDLSQSEDVVQETFVGFLTSLPNYDPVTPLDSFLFSIAAHKLTDVLRRQGRRPVLPLLTLCESSAGPEPVGPARRASTLVRSREDRQAERELIRDCLTNLIRQWFQQRDFERLKCAELLFVLGWANKDVAFQLGLSEQAVANHKHFIVGKIKEAAQKTRLKVPALERLA